MFLIDKDYIIMNNLYIMITIKQNPIMVINDNEGIEPLKIKDAPKVKKMSPAEFIKYAADNHIKFDIPEDNRKFPGQQCQNERLNYKFRRLHLFLVNQVINFCKSNNISINEFHLNADALEDSIKAGSWQSCTDSCLTFDKFNKGMVEFAEDVDKAWNAYWHFNGCEGCVGNGCDDCRDCEEASLKSNLYKKARNMEEGFKNMYGITYKEYKESIKNIDPKEPYLFSM